MRTQVLAVDALNPNLDVVARAAQVLQAGGLVAFPTETVYGLGALALDATAAHRIYAAKGRPTNNPLIVHVADRAGAEQVVAEWTQIADALAARFWPGPLTIVLPKRSIVPDAITGGGSTVAVRSPKHGVAQALLRAVAAPIAAPSANRSTRVSPTCAAHVLATLDGRIDMVLDGGPSLGGVESTVVDCRGDQARMLRPGMIALDELEEVVGPVERAMRSVAASVREAMIGPGQLAKHYAPFASLSCHDESDLSQVLSLALGDDQKLGVLSFCSDLPSDASMHVLVMPREPAGYAARLYAALYELDARGVARILVASPPRTSAWETIWDRLDRAAAKD